MGALRSVERWLLDDLRGDARSDPHAIALKLDKLHRDPFAFFRGTLPQYVRRTRPQLKGALAAPLGLITGDLHLENFGTFFGERGSLVFDLNDFDEVTWAPLIIDLRRLCTSAMLAAFVARRDLAEARLAGEITLEGYLENLGPVLADADARSDPPAAVRALLQESAKQRPQAFVSAATQGPPHARKLKLGPTLHPPSQRLNPALEQALRDWRRRTPPAQRRPESFYALLDVAKRLAGNGSLGRRRYLALLAGPSPQDGHHVLLDLKEPRGSPWGDSPVLLGSRRRALQVERAARALREQSESLLGTARLHGRLFQVREHSPFGMKVSAASLPRADLLEYSRFLGGLLARSWSRAGQPAKELGRALSSGRARLLALCQSDFDQTLEDHAHFREGRERIAHKLKCVAEAA
jgi:uncharacterized protein (DUF2252 family)